LNAIVFKPEKLFKKCLVLILRNIQNNAKLKEFYNTDIAFNRFAILVVQKRYKMERTGTDKKSKHFNPANSVST
jgi:hypothetical protein